jgi:hypothetical protein
MGLSEASHLVVEGVVLVVHVHLVLVDGATHIVRNVGRIHQGFPLLFVHDHCLVCLDRKDVSPVHHDGEQREPDFLDVGSFVEFVDHVDADLAGECLQLDVVLEGALGQQAVLDGEAQCLEKLVLVGDAQEQHLTEVARVGLTHPAQGSDEDLFGLS